MLLLLSSLLLLLLLSLSLSSLYVDPFSADVRIMPLDLQFKLTDLQCDVKWKLDVRTWQMLNFSNLWEKIYIYFKLRSFACSVEAMFATTYVCEKLFSTMKIVKTKFRSRLTDKYLRDQLWLAVSDIIPDFETLSQRHSEDS